VSRFSISIEDELLQKFLKAVKKHGYGNRSEALRDAIREMLVREEWQADDEIVGTISLIYDHHKRDLAERLNTIQHDHHDYMLATMHVHLDHDNCLEIIAVKGRASLVQEIAEALIGMRGVKHGKLSATTTGKKLR
jgi:CopG family nickel-responsive transcriptional regulator